jgi:hypothetical protein
MKSQTDSQAQPNPEMDFEALKSQVKQMAAASPTMVLARIKEIWSVTDESLHPELNLELKRWMLSILNHMDIEQKTGPVDTSDAMCESASLNILALYESQGKCLRENKQKDANEFSYRLLSRSLAPKKAGSPSIRRASLKRTACQGPSHACAFHVDLNASAREAPCRDRILAFASFRQPFNRDPWGPQEYQQMLTGRRFSASHSH